VSGSGRAKSGYWDNVPSGVVYFHPLVVSGVFVADRGVQISGHHLDDKLAHRNPLTVTIASGRVVKHHCKDSDLSARFEDYLSKHPDAGQVGMIAIPTKYLARVEIGTARTTGCYWGFDCTSAGPRPASAKCRSTPPSRAGSWAEGKTSRAESTSGCATVASSESSRSSPRSTTSTDEPPAALAPFAHRTFAP
jgi:hypothetical protein